MVNLFHQFSSQVNRFKIHHPRYWKELEANLDLVFIGIECIFKSFLLLKTSGTISNRIGICFKLVPVASACALPCYRLFTYIEAGYFFAYFLQFLKRLPYFPSLAPRGVYRLSKILMGRLNGAGVLTRAGRLIKTYENLDSPFQFTLELKMDWLYLVCIMDVHPRTKLQKH